MTLEQIIALDKECFMNTFGDRVPVAFDHGCGATLTSLDGREYIDFLAGIAVNSLGHAHPALTRALHEQVDKLIHCHATFPSITQRVDYFIINAHTRNKLLEIEGIHIFDSHISHRFRTQILQLYTKQ